MPSDRLLSHDLVPLRVLSESTLLRSEGSLRQRRYGGVELLHNGLGRIRSLRVGGLHILRGLVSDGLLVRVGLHPAVEVFDELLNLAHGPIEDLLVLHERSLGFVALHSSGGARIDPVEFLFALEGSLSYLEVGVSGVEVHLALLERVLLGEALRLRLLRCAGLFRSLLAAVVGSLGGGRLHLLDHVLNIGAELVLAGYAKEHALCCLYLEDAPLHQLPTTT